MTAESQGVAGSNTLQAFNVSVEFTSRNGGSVLALSDIDMHLTAGEICGVVGESGSGKTTLARCLVGLVRPTRGEVLLEGRRLQDGSGAKARLAIAKKV